MTITTAWGRCTAILTDPTDNRGRLTAQSIDAARCTHVTSHATRRCVQHQPGRTA